MNPRPDAPRTEMPGDFDPAQLAAFYAGDALAAPAPEFARAHAALLKALESGVLRAATPDTAGEWQVQAWVKSALLVGFRRGVLIAYDGPANTAFAAAFDKDTYPPRAFAATDGVRLVPGGSAVRRGAHLAAGVVVMPPAYVNVGAYVGPSTMIDSHALVGSCAQIGARVHLSAGAQIGGVLEPAHARPVIVEDDVFVGALAGVFEGVRVRARAVLAAGVVLTASSVLYDLVHDCTHQREVPAGAVVVPGARRARGAFAEQHGLSLAAPMIVKYRDARTDAATALEQALR